MHASRRSKMVTTVSATMLVALAAPAAFGHGTLSNPPSRIYRAWSGGCMDNPDPFLQGIIDQDVDACWNWHELVNFAPADQYDQFAVPFEQIVPDGKLASADNPRFAAFDTVSDLWPTTPVSEGPLEVTLHAPTPHNPLKMYAFLTTPDHEWGQEPLTWSKMQPIPVGPVTLDGNEYSFTVTLPPRSGKHALYVIWQRIDPVGEGFYMLADVDFGDCGGDCECAGDLDDDGQVDGADLGIMLISWGSAGGDVTGDGTTDASDVATLLGAWGSCGPDCDGDGVSDFDEIDAGAADCNLDGIPDECQQQADCDGDGVWDVCAIGSGQVADCDLDLVPDACQIAADPALDADGNGILDECQVHGFTYVWEIANDWGSGFIANLTIHNDTGHCISGWEALFTASTFTLDSVWNGVLVPQADGTIRILNETWNGDICSGESFTIGMQASGSPSAPVGLVVNDSPVPPAH
ncbi:MAG: lytic polysaccharide monooxygenase [Phycisphaerales bacterium]|jgi:predicted carbohydrate-binding protein with CBM5 and CBM33 domain|nr:lytic polysaccharide monooxygenase [Planctomycetota bacterium]